MRKHILGKTGIEITPIGLGCWQFAQGAGLLGRFWSVLDQDTVTAVVKAALDGGIGWFDTAEAYGGGRSEQALARALHSLGRKPESVVVATKWLPFFRTARSIGATIADRLSCLDGYPIDLHQIHQPASLSPIPAQMREMAALVRTGKIRSVGVSNFSARQMLAAFDALAREGIPLASNQVRYNLLDRRIESNGVLDAAKRLGLTVIAYSPLAQGILTGKFHEHPELAEGLSRFRKLLGRYDAGALSRTAPLIEELRGIAQAHGATVSQIALAWLIRAHGDAVVVIPGASRPRHAEEAAGAMEIELSPEEMSRIDILSLPLSRGRAIGAGPA
jgi:aryl-alcohol dehydrogenase-like predicted oxidoreductase